MNASIDLVPDETLLSSGIVKYIKWDYIRNPHVVIFGSTGSGKTYFLKIILGRIGKHICGSELLVCDYKSDDDFSFLDGSENFYRFDKCMEGLERAVEILKTRQRDTASSRHFFCLVFDECASFINNLDKKSADNGLASLA